MSMSETKPLNQLAKQLIDKKLKLAVAESCTGGMLAQQCTSLSGSSKWFECGFVTYSNVSKIRLLEVEAEVLNEHGAVSSHVAEQMALGVLHHSEADISVSITGVAGPGGGTDDKPVGTVFIASAVKNQVTKVNHYVFDGDRQAIRLQTVDKAILELINRIN